MDQEHVDLTSEDTFLISAIHQEVFSRIFPAIRHDLVGYISASLMRVSIMDRYLHRPETEPEQLSLELKKIETHLKEAIRGIRGMQYWDFEAKHHDSPSNIIKKSVHLMATQLAMTGIQLAIFPSEAEDLKEIETKPLLYTLLCVFSYIEDSNFDINHLNIRQKADSILVTFEALPSYGLATVKKNRNLIINQEFAIKFAKYHGINMAIHASEITLKRK